MEIEETFLKKVTKHATLGKIGQEYNNEDLNK